MKKFFSICTAIFLCVIFGCSGHCYGDYKIYPLSPFSETVKIKDKPAAGQEFIPEIKTMFYIVDEETDLTDKTRTRLENFITTRLKPEVAHNKVIYFTFYKSSFTLGRNSKQTKNQLNTEYRKNKLAEFEYKYGKLYNFDFFKNGTYFNDAVEAERGRSKIQ